RLSSSISGDREYIFKHILTRDVAYESIPRKERAGAHAHVAGWIEQTTAGRRREFAELLAYHFAEAHRGIAQDSRTRASLVEELRGKAFEYLLLAAEESRAKFGLEKAARMAEQALVLARGSLERSNALKAM